MLDVFFYFHLFFSLSVIVCWRELVFASLYCYCRLVPAGVKPKNCCSFHNIYFYIHCSLSKLKVKVYFKKKVVFVFCVPLQISGKICCMEKKKAGLDQDCGQATHHTLHCHPCHTNSLHQERWILCGNLWSNSCCTLFLITARSAVADTL